MLHTVDVTPELVRPIRRSEYHRMVAIGLFEDERVELLRGGLVSMSPQRPRHARVIQTLTRILVLALAERADVRVQLPFAAADDSEPEPDLAVVAPVLYPAEAEPMDDSDDHPSSAMLIIEVADSSLHKDRGIKARLYAESGVPEYWVINLIDRVIEVYTEPMTRSNGSQPASRYQAFQTYHPGQSIALARFSDIRVAVADIL